MISSVCGLLGFNIPSIILTIISSLTGITYAIISNYEADRLIKFFAKDNDLSTEKILLLVLFAILGIGIAFIISNEFFLYWPIFLGEIIRPISILSSIPHFIIFYSNAVELINNINDDFKFSPSNSTKILNSMFPKGVSKTTIS